MNITNLLKVNTGEKKGDLICSFTEGLKTQGNAHSLEEITGKEKREGLRGGLIPIW